MDKQQIAAEAAERDLDRIRKLTEQVETLIRERELTAEIVVRNGAKAVNMLIYAVLDDLTHLGIPDNKHKIKATQHFAVAEAEIEKAAECVRRAVGR